MASASTKSCKLLSAIVRSTAAGLLSAGLVSAVFFPPHQQQHRGPPRCSRPLVWPTTRFKASAQLSVQRPPTLPRRRGWEWLSVCGSHSTWTEQTVRSCERPPLSFDELHYVGFWLPAKQIEVKLQQQRDDSQLSLPKPAPHWLERKHPWQDFILTMGWLDLSQKILNSIVMC